MVHAVHHIMAVICFKNKQRVTRSITINKLTYNFCVGYQKLKTDSTVIQIEWWAETTITHYKTKQKFVTVV